MASFPSKQDDDANAEDAIATVDNAVDTLFASIHELQTQGEATGVDLAKLFEASERLLWEISDVEQRVEVLEDHNNVRIRRQDAIRHRTRDIQRDSEQSQTDPNLSQPHNLAELQEQVKDLRARFDHLLREIEEGKKEALQSTESSRARVIQRIAEKEERHKKQVQKLQLRLAHETHNSTARVQNSFVKSKFGSLLPLKSVVDGRLISPFPKNSFELDKLDGPATLQILELLGTDDSKEGLEIAETVPNAEPDPFDQLWQFASIHDKDHFKSTMEEEDVEVAKAKKEREELEGLRKKLRMYVGLPMHGLQG